VGSVWVSLYSREDLMGEEIHGRTMGLVGLGEIGQRVARIAQGFGLDVLAYDPHLRNQQILAHGATPVIAGTAEAQ